MSDSEVVQSPTAADAMTLAQMETAEDTAPSMQPTDVLESIAAVLVDAALASARRSGQPISERLDESHSPQGQGAESQIMTVDGSGDQRGDNSEATSHSLTAAFYVHRPPSSSSLHPAPVDSAFPDLPYDPLFPSHPSPQLLSAIAAGEAEEEANRSSPASSSDTSTSPSPPLCAPSDSDSVLTGQTTSPFDAFAANSPIPIVQHSYHLLVQQRLRWVSATPPHTPPSLTSPSLTTQRIRVASLTALRFCAVSGQRGWAE